MRKSKLNRKKTNQSGSKMEKITSQKLAQILDYKNQIIDAVVSNVSTDSRKISSETVFVALRGERFDAHDFVAEVIKNGCPLVVVDHIVEGADPLKQIVVKDTLEAYGKIGAYNRSLFKGKVIGLTGSAGKTTTKEEIAFLLSHFGKTYATSGNHNNAVGVPQSLCEFDMNAEYAVIEMGMSAAGEIAYLTNLVKPDIAIVTNVYPMHIEFFENFEGIAYAKAEIFQGLNRNGIAIINEDTNFAEILEQEAVKYADHLIKFGTKHHVDESFELQEDCLQYRYNAWCALEVVAALGLDLKKAADCVKDFGALDGRGKQHRLSFAKGSYTLIDDSYSGQPEAMKLALENLDKKNVSGRKIALLGKMAELGDTSRSRHIEIGAFIAKTSIDIVIGVCPETKDILAQLPPSIEQYYFENKDGVADFLLNKLLQNDDTILIKGARYSSKLYQVTEELLNRGTKK